MHEHADALPAEHTLPVKWPLVALILFVAFVWLGWWSASDPRTQWAYWGGLAAAAATAMGTLPLVVSRTFSARASDCCMGFGAGVMLAASVFSLIIPALDAASANGLGKQAASVTIGGSIIAGAALVWLLQNISQRDGGSLKRASTRRVWLFVLTVGLHNMPEGLAIGVGFGGGAREQASILAFGIALQDIPEGMIVAAALRSIGYARTDAIACGILSGLVEPVASVAGASIVALSSAALPWALGGAAGAMLFVLAHDVIPDPHQRRDGLTATCCLIAGFVVMMVLDTALA